VGWLSTTRTFTATPCDNRVLNPKAFPDNADLRFGGMFALLIATGKSSHFANLLLTVSFLNEDGTPND
jgi:hypothetical protein